jgi:glutamyl-tRNA synthetase
MSDSPVVGRLAPSPTGVLHLGNARSFLLAWLDVRALGGRLLLRIEDLDGPRNKPGAVEATLEDLEWLGLDWDGEPLLQSTRLARHREVRDHLLEEGVLYPCICSRRDVEQAASAPHAGEEGPIYPGTCRARFSPDAAGIAAATEVGGRPPFLRFHCREGMTAVDDLILGRSEHDVAGAFGDFPVWRREDEPAYHLAVVVDDHDQGVDRVLRGDDLLTSAARQVQLHEALNWTPPEYLHVPLVVGADGRRLAKRHGDTSLRHFREQGTSAEEVVGWLGWVSGLQEAPTPCGPRELLSAWDLAKLPRRPVTWTGLLHEGPSAPEAGR